MKKRILITGATDGIGLETAKVLGESGHHLLLHGRNQSKLEQVENSLLEANPKGSIVCYVADLSILDEVESLANKITADHQSLDVLINNAGVFNTNNRITPDGFDVRFVVNTFAPYLLTHMLLPLLQSDGRVINLSSAAQSSVDQRALSGDLELPDFEMYAQSKLAITMWSREMAASLSPNVPSIIAVNPGSMLASKMVKDAFGVPGNDIRIGADILVRAALSDEFKDASGLYFDNDSGQFASPHADALDADRCAKVLQGINGVLKNRISS
ncbi:MAG: SDR family NAD(P)-dependent oxidoreductase [Gammaproteobacteria bacterium]|nr:SDR family NAD(P)-dependent oxidoreductase [Gammaproteobacteria bacterium]NKB63170.1 SDR family NAD(P)-dependent oxidoreductase [Gammaproteobacteria bacterium]